MTNECTHEFNETPCGYDSDYGVIEGDKFGELLEQLRALKATSSASPR